MYQTDRNSGYLIVQFQSKMATGSTNNQTPLCWQEAASSSLMYPQGMRGLVTGIAKSENFVGRERGGCVSEIHSFIHLFIHLIV